MAHDRAGRSGVHSSPPPSFERVLRWPVGATRKAPGDPDHELPDPFHGAVGGLWPHDFEWMHPSGALKDAVTAFEVYLEKAAEEALHRHGLTLPKKKNDQSPGWCGLVGFWKKLCVDVGPPEVRQVRNLRHLLTHRRGELRTEKLRSEHQDPEEPLQGLVSLTEEGVLSAMRQLEDAVQSADPVAYRPAHHQYIL